MSKQHRRRNKRRAGARYHHNMPRDKKYHLLEKAQSTVTVISTDPKIARPTTAILAAPKKPQKPMRIVLAEEVFAKLEAARTTVRGQEVSGFGFVKVNNSEAETVFEVYDAVVMDVGSTGFTEIPATKILPLLDRSDAGSMKLWWHVHPLGGYEPGPTNWSGTDNKTAEEEPLGGVPELVKWSISIVRTPKTWVGRFDKYKDGKAITRHIPVEYGVAPDFIKEVKVLYKEYKKECKKAAAQFVQSPFPVPITRKRGSTVLRFLLRLSDRMMAGITVIGRKIG